MIAGSGPTNRDLTKRGVTLKLTSQYHLNRHEDPPGHRIPKDMWPMFNPHNPTRRCSQKCNRTTQWHWQIFQRRHNTTGHCLRS